MCCNFENTLFSRYERRSSMTRLAIGSIKARDEISEVVVFYFFIFFFFLPVLVLLLLVKTKPLGRGSWTHLSLYFYNCGRNKQHTRVCTESLPDNNRRIFHTLPCRHNVSFSALSRDQQACRSRLEQAIPPCAATPTQLVIVHSPAIAE